MKTYVFLLDHEEYTFSCIINFISSLNAIWKVETSTMCSKVELSLPCSWGTRHCPNDTWKQQTFAFWSILYMHMLLYPTVSFWTSSQSEQQSRRYCLILSLTLNIYLITANPGYIDIAIVVSWLWLAARHPSSCALTNPPQQDGRENKIKKLIGKDKDREITYHLLSLAIQTQLGEHY